VDDFGISVHENHVNFTQLSLRAAAMARLCTPEQRQGHRSPPEAREGRYNKAQKRGESSRVIDYYTETPVTRSEWNRETVTCIGCNVSLR
jgi:hypothetical protein